MIILGTSVVSDTMKPERHWGCEPDSSAQAAETIFLSSVSLAELLFGIAAVGGIRGIEHAGEGISTSHSAYNTYCYAISEVPAMPTAGGRCPHANLQRLRQPFGTDHPPLHTSFKTASQSKEPVENSLITRQVVLDVPLDLLCQCR